MVSSVFKEIDEANRRFKNFWNSLPETEKVAIIKANEEFLKQGIICNPFAMAQTQVIF